MTLLDEEGFERLATAMERIAAAVEAIAGSQGQIATSQITGVEQFLHEILDLLKGQPQGYRLQDF
jgi:hypothetical protein